ncbi:hypothetical protein Rhopal_003915-T1 [Rhodotorula paludigena]|uniref:Cell division cycle protein 123 n=1 Tax=Rhodotorula paludigena TaxID=86838 RepID=A0AAV5GEB0_9BASI|nr:hypothetical protein Rhopal_003915-T1 [Rhodotorula paludigena]
MRDVLACQFSSWYPLFKRCSPKATVIRPIPDEADFLDYLESDGLFLPEGSGPMGISELSDSDDEEEVPADPSASSNASSDEDDEPPRTFSFPRLDAEIRSVLSRYDGAVFPKLNWSSPQDAAWMLPGQNLKCQNPGDVYLLLKSSDFISHDLDHAFDDCVDYPLPATAQREIHPNPPSTTELNEEDLARLTISSSPPLSPPHARSAPTQRKARPYSFELVLKKWFEMPGSQQWRCFVRDNRLLEETRRDLRDKISQFWEDEVRDKAPLSNYVFDVYLTRDASRVFLIDLNPAPELRLVDSPVASASSMPRYSHNRVPKDVIELSQGQSVAEFAKEWMEQVKEATVGGNGEQDSDSEEDETAQPKRVELVGR